MIDNPETLAHASNAMAESIILDDFDGLRDIHLTPDPRSTIM